ncbi:MAG: hypothetical protein D6765_02345 [Bacteroidetes bacterium]|nr:MAG: hypothetical protein D6765_02345 [Bacteroidota bacterium]
MPSLRLSLYLLGALLPLLFLFCSNGSAPQETRWPTEVHYNLNQPDTVLLLQWDLQEISGLSTLSGAADLLAAVNDEEGKIFLLDKTSGRIRSHFEFWKDGDYEGIEWVGDTAFVVKSTGTVYEVRHPGTDSTKTIKFNGFLDRSFDVEGLGYDAQNHQLLLACKGAGGDADSLRLKKAIYAFDLQRRKFLPHPRYVISLEEVHRYLGSSNLEEELDRLLEFFDPGSSELSLSPSAIAVHPLSRNLYILSSAGKLLTILSPQGKILHIQRMKKKVHPQPEGLCFDPDGTLYIANEGKGVGKGTLLRFSPRF